jgi:WD40 repeat protein
MKIFNYENYLFQHLTISFFFKKKADIIIWNFEEKSMMHRLKMHKVLIQSLTFSYNELYLASLGGQDDKNTMIIWDIESGRSLYGSPLGINVVFQQIQYFNKSDDKLIGVLEKGIQILIVDKENRKVKKKIFKENINKQTKLVNNSYICIIRSERLMSISET